MSNLSKKLQEIKERCEKATPGPWLSSTCRDGIYAGKRVLVKTAKVEILGVRQLGYSQASEVEENADFISASRTDIPRLVKALDVCIRQRNDSACLAAINQFDKELEAILEGE